MAEKKNDIFKRLTSLFRNGPTVKKKVRNFKPSLQSSAAEVFKKSQSQIYSNALNAYGQYDRASRYSDFSEMEYTPEICTALDIYAEESTSPDENKNVLHVYSENARIVELLNNLFSDILNLEHNITSWTRNLPIRKDSSIPLVDGTHITIEEVSRRVKSGEDVWVYSVKEDKEIVPGKVSWCDKTRENESIFRVWFNDKTFVDTSYDHEFIMMDGKPKKAIELLRGDLVVPFYKLEDIDLVYDPKSKNVITNNLIKSKKEQEISDLNIPEGKEIFAEVSYVESLPEKEDVYCMEVLGPNGEHDRHNFMVLRKNEEGKTVSEGVCVSNCKYGDFFLFCEVDPETGVSNVHPIPVNEIEREEGYDPENPTAVRFRWISQSNQILEDWQVAHFRLLGNDAFLPYGSSVLESARRIWRQLILIEDAMLVYRVVRSPERRVFYIDVGTVPLEEIPNFIEAAQSKLKRSQVIDKSSGRVDLRYNPLSVDEDYFLPVRGGDTGTKIDTLAGGQHVSDIADVEYIQKKLFSALKVPKAYLGFDDALSSKATLAQEDIRFSRSINRIQRVIISELTKIAIIHLFSHGFEGEELINFSLHLSNPSTVAQQQKLELYRTRFEIAGSAPERLVDRNWVRKNIMNLSDDEIKLIEKGLIHDKFKDNEIDSEGGSDEDAGLFGGGSGGGGGGLGGLGDDDLGDLEGDEDLEGLGDEGGDDDNNEDDEDLFASHKIKTNLSSLVLDEDDDLTKMFNMEKKSKPVKQTDQIKRYKHNIRRRRTHGASKTHMPQLSDIVKFDSDPYDKRYFRSGLSNQVGMPTLKSSLLENEKASISSPDVEKLVNSLRKEIKKKDLMTELDEVSNESDEINIDIDISEILLEEKESN